MPCLRHRTVINFHVQRTEIRHCNAISFRHDKKRSVTCPSLCCSPFPHGEAGLFCSFCSWPTYLAKGRGSFSRGRKKTEWWDPSFCPGARPYLTISPFLETVTWLHFVPGAILPSSVGFVAAERRGHVQLVKLLPVRRSRLSSDGQVGEHQSSTMYKCRMISL